MFTRSARTLTGNIVKTLRTAAIATTASLAVVLTSGCSSNVDESDANNAAISSDEAAKALPSANLVLRGAPSGADAKKLGVVSWDVFTFLNQDFDKSKPGEFNGVAAFGMDKGGDVAYMVVLEASGLAVAKVALDGKASTDALPAKDVTSLMTDVATFKGMLPGGSAGLKTQTSGGELDCSNALARLLLGGVVVGVGGAILIGGLVMTGAGIWGVVSSTVLATGRPVLPLLVPCWLPASR